MNTNTPKEIKSVQPLDNFKLQIEFEDGIRIVDLKTFDLRGVFKKLTEDENLFKTVYLDDEFGTVTWQGGLMLENDDLYKHGVVLKNSENSENINVATLKKALAKLI